MIQFNELRITPDGKYLIIDISIKHELYYDKVFIDSVIIDNQDTYISSGPSSNPVYTYHIDDKGEGGVKKVYTTCDCAPVLSEDTSYCFVTDNKDLRLVLNHQDLNLSLKDNMFFIYAITSGTPAANTPCGMDNSIVMRSVVDLYPFYCKTIQYLKELNNECQLPKGLINEMLRIKALELSIKTGNYTQAVSYWKKYFINSQDKPDLKSLEHCGCNNKHIF